MAYDQEELSFFEELETAFKATSVASNAEKSTELHQIFLELKGKFNEHTQDKATHTDQAGKQKIGGHEHRA